MLLCAEGILISMPEGNPASSLAGLTIQEVAERIQVCQDCALSRGRTQAQAQGLEPAAQSLGQAHGQVVDMLDLLLPYAARIAQKGMREEPPSRSLHFPKQ